MRIVTPSSRRSSTSSLPDMCDEVHRDNQPTTNRSEHAQGDVSTLGVCDSPFEPVVRSYNLTETQERQDEHGTSRGIRATSSSWCSPSPRQSLRSSRPLIRCVVLRPETGVALMARVLGSNQRCARHTCLCRHPLAIDGVPSHLGPVSVVGWTPSWLGEAHSERTFGLWTWRGAFRGTRPFRPTSCGTGRLA